MKKILAFFTILLMILVGCGSKVENVSSNMILDRLGEEIIVPEKLDRIMSASASNTEILVALGLADKIVAYDIYASDVEGLNQDAIAIDFRAPDLEQIIALKPDVIFANDYNKAGQDDPFSQLSEAGIPVIYIPSSSSIEEIYVDIQFFSKIAGNEDKGNEIVNEMKSKIDEIRKISETIETKKLVYFEINPAPYVSSFGKDTFLNEILELIGAENIFADASGWITPNEEVIIEKNPGVILTNVNFIDNPIDEINSRAGWNTIDAVKNDLVFQVPTNETSRATQNIVIGIESIAKAVYPEYYE